MQVLANTVVNGGGMGQLKREHFSCEECGTFAYIIATCSSCGYTAQEGSELSVPHEISCSSCSDGYIYSGKCSTHNLTGEHYYCDEHSYVSTSSRHTYTCSHGETTKHDS